MLLAVAALSWIVALVLRRDDTPVSGAAVGLMALTGGALVASAPIAMVFPAVAVFSAAVRWRIRVGAVVARRRMAGHGGGRAGRRTLSSA